ncbi:MAG: hypothetical protein IPI66_15625 [Chitinophagaceae bacterium]|nr:hypothetical protein [Chitinophagaceae bacterium]
MKTRIRPVVLKAGNQFTGLSITSFLLLENQPWQALQQENRSSQQENQLLQEQRQVNQFLSFSFSSPLLQATKETDVTMARARITFSFFNV